MRARHRAVITGLGVVAPNGIGVARFWETLQKGLSGIGPVTLFDASDLPCRIAGEVRGFRLEQHIDSQTKTAKRMSRSSQFAVASAVMALRDAGLELNEIRTMGDIPVVMGISTSAMDLIAVPPHTWTAVAAVPHATGSAITYTLGFDARLLTISNGCASGVDAVAYGASEIRRGKAEVVLAGAADSSVTRYVFECFSKSRKLSTRNEEPERASRPFDRERDGGIISEAAGIMVIEDLAHARARGAVPYAEVTGYGSGADPGGQPVGAGLAGSMRKAMSNVPCRPEAISHISMHAPSDSHMDQFETELIKKGFGDHAFRMPVTSVKGATGNPMGAGGILQAIAAALSIRDGLVPPTANLENPDPACDLDYVMGTPRAALLEKVLVNTHGFGRGNSSIVLERIK